MVWWHTGFQLFLMALAIVTWGKSMLWLRGLLAILTVHLSMIFACGLTARATWLHSTWSGLIFYKRDQEPFLYWMAISFHGLIAGLAGVFLLTSFLADNRL